VARPYPRVCNVCGQTIIMAQDPRGLWQPMEPDNSGRHVHWSGVDAGHNHSPSASVTDRDSRFTYQTTCWWCGELVYFHTNGYGDSVLFDRLGWPWEVHACWEGHVYEREVAVAALDFELDRLGVSGERFFETDRPAARRGRSVWVSISGFVSNNHANHEEPQVYAREATRGASSIPLVAVEVDADDGLR